MFEMTSEHSLKKILLVDDDPSVREVVSYLLRSEGFTVIETHSGQSALHLLSRDSNIRLVVSDLQMPEGDGLWLLKRIRQDGNSVPFILITGNQHWTSEKANTEGVSDFYHKPLPTERLEQLMQSVRAFLKA